MEISGTSAGVGGGGCCSGGDGGDDTLDAVGGERDTGEPDALVSLIGTDSEEFVRWKEKR
jgi:hypothetical protein